jgi:plasminogen activator inhibitor 1 RNA-binding protein
VEGVKEEEKPAVEGAVDEKKPEAETPAEAVVEEGAVEKKEEEEEDNEMTLDEYEKVLEEKRKTLEAAKASERKVEADKAFEKMQLVDNKRREEDIFIKLGQDKEKTKREAAEKEEKSRKPVSINEFLKPAEGEKYYGPPSNRGRGGRGGRGDRREGGERREGGGRGDRESSRGAFGGGRFGGRGGSGGGASAPKIEDQAQFPTLGGK